MTEQEFQTYLDKLSTWNNNVIPTVFLNDLDPIKRKRHMQALQEHALWLGVPLEEFKMAYKEVADKFEGVQEKRCKDTFVPFVPFAPPDISKLPVFPVDKLPPVLREFVKAVAENLQAPIDMPAASALAIVSACAQGKFVVNVKPGWTEQLNLYIVVIARPSERKSPTLRVVAKPLYQYSKEENQRREPEIKRYRLRKEMLEKSIASLKDRAAKPSIKGKEVSFEEVEAKQKELDELEEVHALRLIADDITPEKLVSLMAANNGRMSVISAEGGLFDILAGLYNSKVNIDPFLKAYTGDSIQIDRQGRPSETIDSPALTMLLMIQPSVLDEIMRNREFDGRGLTARFLYSYPASMIGRGRKYNTSPVPTATADAYKELIYTLLNIPDSEEPQVIYLTDEAQQISEEFFYSLEDQLVDELGDVEAWAGKYHGQIMRIAGLIHCCLHQEDASAELMTGGTLQAAIAIGRYFMEHAKAVFRLMGECEPEEEKLAKYILKRMDKAGDTEINKRDLFKLCYKKTGLGTTEEFDKILQVLIDRGYMAIDEIVTGGRPTERIYLNPLYVAAKGTKGTKAPKPSNL